MNALDRAERIARGAAIVVGAVSLLLVVMGIALAIMMIGPSGHVW
jgi:hypothetical protein